MNEISIDENLVLEYICDIVSSIKYSGSEVNDSKYHHNTDYKDAPLICRYGILTLEDMNKYGIRNDSDEFLQIMNDINSHVNGIDSVSLSISNLKDLYVGEEEYNPFSISQVDFLVTSNIKTFRTTINYGNEFLSFESISNDKLRSVDIRLMKLAKLKKMYNDYSLVASIIQKFNHLREIAFEIKKQELDIPVREMSESEIYNLDIDKLSSHPKLKIKK